MKISFLIHNAYGIGGTNRAVINLAEALSARHEVEIVSVFRRQNDTMFDISPRVSVTPLVDLRTGRPDRRHRLLQEASRFTPETEEFHRLYSGLTDERIARHLKRSDADVIVGTRPGLSLCVARLARDSAVKVAQEHMTHEMVPAQVRDEMRAYYPRLDAAVTVTDADAEVFRATTPVPGLRLLTIPNSVPEPTVAPADGSSRIVMAAGRLSDIKRYDVLVHAFAKVVLECPKWTLRIYGQGPNAAALRGLVTDLGLHDNVLLMGRYTPLESEWAKASIAAVTSDQESFGMTLVEAMRCGVPVVSTACPAGPPEIIDDGVDGLLVPVGDVDAVASGLRELINNEDTRRRMGEAARRNTCRFDPAAVADVYEQLLRELLRDKAARGAQNGRYRSALTSTACRMRATVGRKLAAGLRWRGSRVGARDHSPLADCVVDSAGNVTISVPEPGVGRAPLSLLCQERSDKGRERLVRAAFVTTGVSPDHPRQLDGPQRVELMLPADAEVLTEGRWNLFLEGHDGTPHRLRPGLLDLRGLLADGAKQPRLPLVRHVPYRTADGFLALRSWVRARHAEACTISYGDEVLSIAGRLVGEAFGAADPVLTLTRRQPPGMLTVVGTSSGGADFWFDIPLRELTTSRRTRHDDWDLAVTVPSVPEPVRLARLLDDVVERKRVYTYPAIRVDEEYPPELVDEAPAPQVRVRPYFTVNSELSLVVSDQD